MTRALTYIGGPTALLEWRGVRLLTDPTFDPHLDQLGAVDVALVSHEHTVFYAGCASSLHAACASTCPRLPIQGP